MSSSDKWYIFGIILLFAIVYAISEIRKGKYGGY